MRRSKAAVFIVALALALLGGCASGAREVLTARAGACARRGRAAPAPLILLRLRGAGRSMGGFTTGGYSTMPRRQWNEVRPARVQILGACCGGRPAGSTPTTILTWSCAGRQTRGRRGHGRRARASGARCVISVPHRHGLRRWCCGAARPTQIAVQGKCHKSLIDSYSAGSRRIGDGGGSCPSNRMRPTSGHASTPWITPVARRRLCTLPDCAGLILCWGAGLASFSAFYPPLPLPILFMSHAIILPPLVHGARR